MATEGKLIHPVLGFYPRLLGGWLHLLQKEILISRLAGNFYVMQHNWHMSCFIAIKQWHLQANKANYCFHKGFMHNAHVFYESM